MNKPKIITLISPMDLIQSMAEASDKMVKEGKDPCGLPTDKELNDLGVFDDPPRRRKKKEGK